MISDENLKTYNTQGLIPGPDENEDEFIRRAEFNLKFAENISDKPDFPFPLEKSPEVMSTTYPITLKLYGIAPSWTFLLFSNHKLAPWHGAVAWIFQLEENSPLAAFIQLRKVIKTQKIYFKIYHRDELLAHEISHIGRMAFEEPRYEEILAYQTSSSLVQRYLGPLIQSKHEATMFMSFLLLIVLANFYVLFTHNWPLYSTLFWLQTTPLWFLLYAAMRLYRKYSIFNKTFSKLKEVLSGSEKAHAVIYRLTDAEIKAFAKKSIEDIQSYANASSQHNLRWRAIVLCYFR